MKHAIAIIKVVHEGLSAFLGRVRSGYWISRSRRNGWSEAADFAVRPLSVAVLSEDGATVVAGGSRGPRRPQPASAVDKAIVSSSEVVSGRLGMDPSLLLIFRCSLIERVLRLCSRAWVGKVEALFASRQSNAFVVVVALVL